MKTKIFLAIMVLAPIAIAIFWLTQNHYPSTKEIMVLTSVQTVATILFIIKILTEKP